MLLRESNEVIHQRCLSWRKDAYLAVTSQFMILFSFSASKSSPLVSENLCATKMATRITDDKKCDLRKRHAQTRHVCVRDDRRVNVARCDPALMDALQRRGCVSYFLILVWGFMKSWSLCVLCGGTTTSLINISEVTEQKKITNEVSLF